MLPIFINKLIQIEKKHREKYNHNYLFSHYL